VCQGEAATRLSGLFSGQYDLLGGTEVPPLDKVGLVEKRGCLPVSEAE